MKSLRKIFAAMICLSMIISCTFTGVTFAASEFTDLTQDNAFYQAIIDLADKGIIDGMANEDGTSFRFEPDSTITRAEFAKLVAVADAPAGFVFANKTSSFTDVAADYWAVSYIEYAVGRKIINGILNEDGVTYRFNPTAPVTYAEAMKMIVCALNYGNVINTENTNNDPNWKWYDPYLSLGNQLNLNKNASIPAENPASRGLIAQMVFNMNKATPAVQTGTDAAGNPLYGLGDSSKEESSKGTKTEEGQLLAVFRESITGENEGLNKKEALLKVGNDEEIFLIGNYSVEEIAAFLGYEVKITYSEDNSGENVIEKIVKTSSNEEYIISDIDISNIESDEIEYYDEDSRKGVSTLKFASDMKVFRNGGIIDMENLVDEMNIDSGEIRFVDYDGNGKMDLAFIKSYETMYVGSVTNSNGKYTVYDKFDSTRQFVFDNNNDGITVKVMANGSDDFTNGSLSSIASSNVISVAVAADDEEEIEIIVSKKTVSGSTATSEVTYVDGDYTVIGFKKGEYDVSSYYIANLENTSYPQEVSTGDICTVYLDFTGKIAAVNKTTATMSYGYITKVGRATSGSMDNDDYMVSMYDASGKYYAKLPVAEKVKINDSNGDGAELATAIADAAAIVNAGKDEGVIENAEKAVLVKYEISGGALKSVYVISEDDNKLVASHIFESNTDDEISANDYLSFDSGANAFKLDGTTKFKISASTKVFVVPLDRNDDDYRVTTGTGYFTNGGHYKIDAYDVEGNAPAKAVVVYGVDTTIKPNTDTIFVKKIEDTQNDDGKEVQLLYYHTVESKWDDEQNGNTYQTIMTKEANTLNGVQSGDIIKLFKLGDTVERIQHIYSVTDGLLIDDVIADGGEYNEETGLLKHNVSSLYYNIMYGTVTLSPKEDAGNGNMDVSFDFDAEEYIEYLEALENAEEGEEIEEYTFSEVGFKTSSTTAIIRYIGNESSGRNPEIFEFGKIAEDIIDINPDASAASKVVVFRYGDNAAAKAIIIYE